jgi:hypothetical protein
VVAVAAFLLLAASMRAANRLHINIPVKPSTLSQQQQARSVSQVIQSLNSAKVVATEEENESRLLVEMSGMPLECYHSTVRVNGGIPFGLKT